MSIFKSDPVCSLSVFVGLIEVRRLLLRFTFPLVVSHQIQYSRLVGRTPSLSSREKPPGIFSIKKKGRFEVISSSGSIIPKKGTFA